MTLDLLEYGLDRETLRLIRSLDALEAQVLEAQPEPEKAVAPFLEQPSSTLPLLEFIPHVSPRYHAPLHLAPLVRVLERAYSQGGVFAVVSCPPQHFKTETVLHGIARGLSLRPDWTTAYASYAQKFSESKTLKAQRYAISAGVRPDPRMQNLSEFRTIEGGGILTTSVSGPLTGQAVDVAVVDDPFRDREQANSKTYRNAVWGWFEDVLETRFQPHTSVIVVFTRWHEDDLGGRILKNRLEYDYIRIPALADGLDALGKSPAPDPLGRTVGEPLLPSRKTRAELEAIREQKPYTFTALYQGLPRPRQGRLFDEPRYYRTLPEGLSYGLGLDLAYTKSTHANYTAVTEGATNGQTLYLTRAWHWQEVIGHTTQQLKSIQERRPGAKFRVENNGPQKGVNDSLENSGVRLDRFTPVSDKLARAQSFIEDWAAGNILLPDPEVFPEAKAWLGDFLEEIQAFSGISDPVDDWVDASVNLHSQLMRAREVQIFL